MLAALAGQRPLEGLARPDRGEPVEVVLVDDLARVGPVLGVDVQH